MAEISTDQLTDGELAALEASGVDVTGPMVKLPETKTASAAPAEKTTKTVEAPPPPPEVVQRVKERVAAQQELEGSSYEIKDADGKVVKKVGSTTPAEPEEDPVEAADKQAFLIHILGGQRFTKSYDLFGGAMTVTFRTRTTAEDETCANQAFYDEQLDGGYSGNTLETRNNQRLQRYYDYQFVASLYSIKVKGSPPRMFSAFEGKEHPLRAARQDLNVEFSQALKLALRAFHNRFEALVAKLVGEANSKDFWEAGSDT
jgi:hypothetical protein